MIQLTYCARTHTHTHTHTQTHTHTERWFTQVSLTLDADQHELVEGQGAVVGDHLGGLDAAQADLAEVLLAGQAGQRRVGQVGVLGHWEREGPRQGEGGKDR